MVTNAITQKVLKMRSSKGNDLGSPISFLFLNRFKKVNTISNKVLGLNKFNDFKPQRK